MSEVDKGVKVFHVKLPNCDGADVSRESLPDAELSEYQIEQILDIDAASHPTKSLGRHSELLSPKVQPSINTLQRRSNGLQT